MDSGKVKIGYWKIRGLISPVRYLLEYLGVEYEDVQYEQGDGPEFSRDAWLSVKQSLGLDFPNIPYLFHKDVHITESQAILRYIANEFAPASFSGKDSRDKAYVDMIFSVVGDIKSAVTMSFYTGDPDTIKRAQDERWPAVEKYLGDKAFFAGDYVTFVDFFVWEQIELFEWFSKGEFMKQYPKLAAYHARVAALPKFAEYIKSDRFMKRPFNNKVAKINN